MGTEMNKLKIDLENCYGIKKLKDQFDFSSERAYAIYAPNGAMKSSLAQTFQDVADGIQSKDRIFPSRVCRRIITDENNQNLNKDSVLVIQPYEEALGHTEKTSTLLVDAKLREEYENLHEEINQSKSVFLKALKEQSRSKKDLEKEISSAFTSSDNEFFRALVRIKDELLTQKYAPFANIEYDKIFDEKVLGFLGTKDFKTAIEDYIKKYNELLAASTYFKKGIFTYYHAGTIAKSLADNGFFDAQHSVSLNGTEKLEITNVKQLEELIAKEKEGISKDKDLRKKYAELEKLIQRNTNVRDFENYLAEHEEILPNLSNIEKFKEEIWKSFLMARIDLYKDLLAKYQTAEKRKEEIEQEAGKQRTQWESVIEIFNERFFVPFKLTAKNKASVILGQEPMLTLGFTYVDGVDNVPVDKATLMQTLSTGEKKALYVLNIIFEVEARKKANQETIFIVDDIADSFDYKNKYAIIQYLKDIAEEPNFSQLILTHNFDFFRTVQSRFVGYSHCRMAIRSNKGELTLQKAIGIRNIFVNDWKINFFTEPRKKIASIPFIRNIIEYTKGDQDNDFIKLTSLLHYKADSEAITIGDLDKIFHETFGATDISPDSHCLVINVLCQMAQDCMGASTGINFETRLFFQLQYEWQLKNLWHKK